MSVPREPLSVVAGNTKTLQEESNNLQIEVKGLNNKVDEHEDL